MPKKVEPIEPNEFPQPEKEPELIPPHINEDPKLPNEEPPSIPDENPEQKRIPEIPDQDKSL